MTNSAGFTAPPPNVDVAVRDGDSPMERGYLILVKVNGKECWNWLFIVNFDEGK